MSSVDVVAFVHAKTKSERLPGKNMADLGGKPLVAHAIEAALAAEAVQRVVVDSDSDEILDVGRTLGAEALKRPAELATNETTGDDLAYWQAMNSGPALVIVQVVPTCPFTKPLTICRVVVEAAICGCALSVRQERLAVWKRARPFYAKMRRLPNSVDWPTVTWDTSGVYAMNTEAVLKTRKRVFGRYPVGLLVSAIEAIDINTQEDLDFARIVYAGMKALKQHG